MAISFISTHERYDFSVTHNRDVIGGAQYFFELVANKGHSATFGLHNIAKYTKEVTTFFRC